MIQITDKTLCTGCTACQQVCAHSAIRMHFDENGHSYPAVDTLKCVDCGLCDKVCPMLHIIKIPSDIYLDRLPVYAVYNKDENVRKRSTSGGFFSLLAEYVISLGGVVFAARFSEEFQIIHTYFDDIGEIDNFRGSKYAQSRLDDTFKLVRKELKNRPVLFVGTPCQVAGLKGFLIKDYDNLYTYDFICMGISSPIMWEKYLNEYWNNKHIDRVFFKDKRYGWHNWKMLVQYEDGKEYLQNGMKDPFFYLYLTHLSFRPSCFSCPFRTCRRVSDFTIADCWGIDKVDSSFDDDKGCTTLILQNTKAENVFSNIKKDLFYHSYSIEIVKEYNPYICRQIEKNPCRDDFFAVYREKGFKAAVSRYCKIKNPSFIRRVLSFIRGML